MLLRTRQIVILLLVAGAITTAPSLAGEKFGDRPVIVTLTTPIHIQDCLDGREFSAVVKKAGQLNVPENTTLDGHLHITTPDKRAPRNQQIELCFETLNMDGKKIPITCRLAPLSPNLEVTHNKKKISYPLVGFHAPGQTLGSVNICTWGGTTDNRKAYARNKEIASKKAAIANREAEKWNMRYGLSNSNQTVILSSRYTPLELEVTDDLRVYVSTPIEMPDHQTDSE